MIAPGAPVQVTTDRFPSIPPGSLGQVESIFTDQDGRERYAVGLGPAVLCALPDDVQLVVIQSPDPRYATHG